MGRYLIRLAVESISTSAVTSADDDRIWQTVTLLLLKRQFQAGPRIQNRIWDAIAVCFGEQGV